MSAMLPRFCFLILLTTVAQSGLANACPSGYEDLWIEGDSCFTLVDEFVDFLGAEDRCLELGGRLASIHSEEENLQIAGYLEQHRVDAWIGMRFDGNEWEWVDVSQVDYLGGWGPDEPFDMNNQHNCTFFGSWGNGYYWTSFDCVVLMNFVCKAPRSIPQTTVPAETGCPAGYEDLWTEGDSCYTSMEEECTFLEAESICLELGGHLVSIHSPEENRVIMDHFGQAIGVAWIGLKYDGNEWKWVDDSPMDYDGGWAEGEPSGDPDEFACAYIYMVRGWTSYPCDSLTFPLCKAQKLKPPATTTLSSSACPSGYEDLWTEGDSCYEIVAGHRKAFHEAEAACAEKGGHLVSIHSAEEDQAIRDRLPLSNKHVEYWIGLKTDDGTTWDWVDGSPMDYVDGWAEDEPSGSSDYECASISFYEDGSWVNMKCADAMEFVCKAPKQLH